MNIIYDSLFKYFIENQHVAVLFAQSIFKQKVLYVHALAQEYPLIEVDGIKLRRIDFAATVLNEQGEESIILIELQKARSENELIRFRQYLAAFYRNTENVKNIHHKKRANQMISVYICGNDDQY